jgi:hypothetical protein
MDNDEALVGLLDDLMGATMVAQAFMAQTALSMARQSADPPEWMKTFMSRLESAIDQHERATRLRAEAKGLPVSNVHYELARRRIDMLAADLAEALRADHG